MKLQKRLSRVYQGKKYFKWIVVIPPEEIIDSGFKEGDELRIDSEDGKIILTKKDEKIVKKT